MMKPNDTIAIIIASFISFFIAFGIYFYRLAKRNPSIPDVESGKCAIQWDQGGKY